MRKIQFLVVGASGKPELRRMHATHARSTVYACPLRCSSMPAEALMHAPARYAGGLSAVQVHAVHLACARHETYLQTGQRAGCVTALFCRAAPRLQTERILWQACTSQLQQMV